jgi:hypothetical protein
MTDSFAAVLMVGLLSVQEASDDASLLITSHQFAQLVGVVCSMCKNPSSTRKSSVGRRLDSDAHAIRVVRSCGFCKTVSVWPDMPAVSKIWERRNLLLGAWDWQRKSAGVISDRDTDIAR